MSNNTLKEIQRIRIENELSKLQSHELRNLVTKWIESGGPINIVGYNKNKKKELYARADFIYKFIRVLGMFVESEQDLNWKSYCLIQNQINVSFKNITYRHLLSSLYLYSSTEAASLEVRVYLNKYQYLFLIKELTNRTLGKENNDYIAENILTNFPITSTENEIIQLTKNNYTYHFYAKSLDKYNVNLLKIFLADALDTANLKNFNTIYLRTFICLFDESLNGIHIKNLKHFNEHTYRQQYKFFINKCQEYNWIDSDLKRMRNSLNNFYFFIDDYYMNNTGTSLFNTPTFNTDLIRLPNSSKYFSEDYLLVIRNPIDDVPKEDKLVLLTGNSNNNPVKNGVQTLDFTIIPNEDLKMAFKKYFWFSNFINKEIGVRFNRLAKFINEALIFYEKEMKIIEISASTSVQLFSSNFLIYYYYNLISNGEYSDSTKNLIIAQIRSFLEYIRLDYEISNYTIKQMAYLKVDSTGGKPISESDFININRAFKGDIVSIEGELLYIIFQLSLTTKLRIGEVLSLERDCIQSIDEEAGYGTVKYLKKTSAGEYVYEIFLLNHIRLIERAILLTQLVFEKAKEEISRYIFIWWDVTRKGRVMSLRNHYNDKFRRLISELHQKGEIGNKYTPYNARDTYIDTAWQGVEDGVISSLEITSITGNKATTAIKHYRNRNNIQRYLEAMFEVVIPDMELDGNILENEETIKNYPPVNQESGSCSSEKCIKKEVENEDSEYLCLTCPMFVTTTNRAHIFEQRLNEYQIKYSESKTSTEKNYYKGLMEIHGAYLARIYSLLEEKL